MQKINTNFTIEKEKLPPSGIPFNFLSLLIFEIKKDTMSHAYMIILLNVIHKKPTSLETFP
jgi:hypothetical protein